MPHPFLSFDLQASKKKHKEQGCFLAAGEMEPFQPRKWREQNNEVSYYPWNGCGHIQLPQVATGRFYTQIPCCPNWHTYED